MPGIRVPAFAKINLQLRILGKRPDGYHELRTIFQSISLHDELELELTRSGAIELSVEGDESLAAESSQDNLVYRALDAARRELNLKAGVRARLKKVTPVGRGLGGGSSDAAAALMGLQRLAKREIPTARLIEIGASLGADVPFFLFGGTAVGVGRGDEIYPLPDAQKFTVLIVSPRDIAVRTADAYCWLNAQPLGAPAKLTNPGTTPKLPPLCALCWSPQEITFSNDFEKAVFPRHPRLAEIKRELLQRGAAEASLAGSGSAVFGRFQNPAQARRTARTFPQDQVFICETLSRGEYRRAQRGRAASGSRSRR
ncbi:MAG TPA: 4-(cytidine 5'-diphospho)-2-C-methyl-D-erythritol kinase [Candidatus Acidoferrales bacterium]|nr:4-(cytidine 5'-diphospho)-2-C-methyl-D-erythritol kinase [Candidatus Acidoferrales bacterium]